MNTEQHSQSSTSVTIKELKDGLKKWGRLMKIEGEEIEVYPKGKRGALSYFTDDRLDALSTARKEALSTFEMSLDWITNEHVEAALYAWYSLHGSTWKSELLRAWSNGNYGKLTMTPHAGNLQRFRNADGHEAIEHITRNL